MSHEAARTIFNEIRARPYRVNTAPGLRAENCYFKGIELLQRLGALGYAVRGVIGETYWDPTVFPVELLRLLPEDTLATHFWCEAELDGAWIALDTSFNPELAKHGFAVSEFGDGVLCFPITRRYAPDEMQEYMAAWNEPGRADAFFKANASFFSAFNTWIAGLS